MNFREKLLLCHGMHMRELMNRRALWQMYLDDLYCPENVIEEERQSYKIARDLCLEPLQKAGGFFYPDDKILVHHGIDLERYLVNRLEWMRVSDYYGIDPVGESSVAKNLLKHKAKARAMAMKSLREWQLKRKERKAYGR